MYTSSLLEVTRPGKSAPAKKLPTIAMVGVAKKTPVAPATVALTPWAQAATDDVDLPPRRRGLLAGSRAGFTESDAAALSRDLGLRHSRHSPAILAAGVEHLPVFAGTATVATIVPEPAKASETGITNMPVLIFVRLAAGGDTDKHSPSFLSALLKTTAASISTAPPHSDACGATPCGLSLSACRLRHVLFDNVVADR
jgi:hypothetical protein